MSEKFVAKDSGIELTLRAIPTRLVLELLSQIPLPDPPTYTIETAGGGTRTFPHDAASIEETPEDRPAWNEYLERYERVATERAVESHKFMIMQGIVENPPPLEEWSINYALWKLNPPDPEDKVSYKVRWIEEMVCADPADMRALVIALQGVAQMTEDNIMRLITFFRSARGGSAA